MPHELPGPVGAAIDAANRGDTEEFIGVEVSLTVSAVESAGANTTVTTQVGGKGFNGPSHFTFAVEGDRVTRMTIRA